DVPGCARYVPEKHYRSRSGFHHQHTECGLRFRSQAKLHAKRIYVAGSGFLDTEAQASVETRKLTVCRETEPVERLAPVRGSTGSAGDAVTSAPQRAVYRNRRKNGSWH